MRSPLFSFITRTNKQTVLGTCYVLQCKPLTFSWLWFFVNSLSVERQVIQRSNTKAFSNVDVGH